MSQPRRLLTVPLVVCLFAVGWVVSVTHVTAAGAVSLLSSSAYTDSAGYLHVIGEVQNTGGQFTEFVQANVNYYNASGTLLAADTTYANLDDLAPGERSPFEDLSQPPSGYDHYQVASVAGNATTTPPNHNFTTQTTNDFVDSSGFEHVVGTVTNNNSTSSDYVEPVYTFYSSGGGVVDDGLTFVNTNSSSTLGPGATASYELLRSPDQPAYSSKAVLTQSTSASSTSPSPSSTATPTPTSTPTPMPTSTPTPTPSVSPSPSPSGTSNQGGNLQAVSPSRILDTRDGTGGVPVAPIGQGASEDVQVTGRGGIPASGVSAVVMNVTVTDGTEPSFLTVYPTGPGRPLASNLDFTAGETVPNLVEIAVGSGGQVSVYNNSGLVDVIFDVAGYVVSPGSSSSSQGQFHPLVPSRLLDTRDGTGSNAAPLGTGATLALQVVGRGGVPASGVSGVVLNVTVTNPTSNSFLTVSPDGSARPLASNLNYLPGQTVPNRVVVKVGSDGMVDLYNSAGTVDVIGDVDGYYTDGTGAATGASFDSVNPSRVLDTRDGTGGSNGPVGPSSQIVLQVAGVAGIPSMSSATPPRSVVLNLTETNPTASGYITASPDGTPRPVASDLNFVSGETSPNLLVVKVGFDGSIDLFNSAGYTDLVADVVGWYDGPAYDNPYGDNFSQGNFIYSPPSDLCSYFDCIPSFWNQTNGYVEQCSDLMFSHSGGVQGACSSHGGSYRPLYSH